MPFFPESTIIYRYSYIVVEIDDETSKERMEERKERLTYFLRFYRVVSSSTLLYYCFNKNCLFSLKVKDEHISEET